MDISKMFIEYKSQYNLEETFNRLSTAIAEGGWKINHVHNMQETMEKNNFKVSPIQVIELCRPDYAYSILSQDDLRLFTPMMPCRISIYEKSDGVVYVSVLNTGMMASFIGGVAEEVMSKAYGDTTEFVKKLI